MAEAHSSPTGSRWTWRARVLGVVVPVACVLVAAALAAPEPPLPDMPRLPGASETQCLPIDDIDTVRELDRFVRTVRSEDAFAGGDVGASTALQDGRLLFVFGDTLRSDSFDGQKFVRNSMLVVTPGDCASVVLPADHGALIPDRDDGVGYWPMSIAHVERTGYDIVGVAAQRVRSNDDPDAGIFAFDILGPSVALFVVPAGGTPQLIAQDDLGPDQDDSTRPMWGAASVVTDGWIYLYGTARPEGATVNGFSLQLARVRIDDVLDLDRWRYWDGRAWSPDPVDAAVLIPHTPGVSQTLSVFRDGRTWYAVSKQGEVLGTELTLWAAPGPTGPFTVADVPALIPSDAGTGTLRYLPLAHPALFPREGTVVVSYSENNTDFEAVLDDPRRYRPRFLRIQLP